MSPPPPVQFSSVISRPIVKNQSLIVNFQIAVWLRLEVALVIVVYTYEPIFTSRCITLSRRVDRQPKLGQNRAQYVNDDRSYLFVVFHESLRLRAGEGGTYKYFFKKNSRIDRSEMSFHSPDFLLEYLVPETSLEFTLS